MTKNGIVHLAFHPCTDRLVLAAADKSGHIGLWSVDNEAQPPSASETKENQAQGETLQNGDQPQSGILLMFVDTLSVLMHFTVFLVLWLSRGTVLFCLWDQGESSTGRSTAER